MEINPDKLEVAPGTVHEGIEGWVPELASDDDIRVALEKAFDYRGDVTVTLKSGAKVEGIRKYWEKKAAGEGNLNLQPEPLE